METSGPPVLGVVVPCYNEIEVIDETARQLGMLLEKLSAEGLVSDRSRVFFVDDGSRDGTWERIRELAAEDGRIHGARLSRNRGHQNALIAGLFNAGGDILVSVDADLQDDLNAIREMLAAHRDGAEIVYGVRRTRDTDTPFKRFTAQAFYRLMDLLYDSSVYNHADFRLMSRRAVEHLKSFSEVNLFLRGMVPMLGFESATVAYDRHPRFAGKTKYPLRRMISLALNGATAVSVAPLRAISALGFLVFSISILISAWVLLTRIFYNDVVPGWASTTLPIYFLGGVQLLCLGVIGEYLGKIYLEVKRRPRYIIAEELPAAGDAPDRGE